jgi:hypothetical protein
LQAWEGKIAARRQSVLNGNAQNPTAFAGKVGLDDDIGLHVLQALTSPLYIWLT